MSDDSIKTTCGQEFTHADHCKMARLIYRRFGFDLFAAAAAWRRMLQNSCSDTQFHEMAQKGAIYLKED